MPAWLLSKTFHIDIGASYGSHLIRSGTDSSLLNPAPDIILGDTMPVQICFWSRTANGGVEVAAPDETSTIIFSGRPAGAPSGSELLFLTNYFTQSAPGVWDGTLNFATAELASHLASGRKTILGEIEIRTSGNTARQSFQFDLSARPQVYADDDTPPAVLPSPEEWLQARRPAPIHDFTPAEPVNGTGQSQSVTLSGTSAGGSVTITIASPFLEDSIVIAANTWPASTPAADIALAIQTALRGNLAFKTAGFQVDLSGAVLTFQAPYIGTDTVLTITTHSEDSGITVSSAAYLSDGDEGTTGIFGQHYIADDSHTATVYLCTRTTPSRWTLIS